MATRTQDNICPVKWTVEYKPPGGNWTVLAIDSAYPGTVIAANTSIKRSYNTPQGALGTWQIRVTFEPVATQVRREDYLGNIYYELGEFARAREMYARATSLDSENPRTHFNLGNACDEIGDLLGAARAYRRAIALWPGYADAHFNLALVAEKLSSWSLARKHWERFLDLEPGSEWAAVARSHLTDAKRAESSRRKPQTELEPG